MISQLEGLAIAQLIFFSPGLLISVWLIFKHGFGRDQAWFFTTLLCLCRIIGTACLIAADNMTTLSNSTYTSLLTAYYVCNGIGVSFLIQALLCLVSRVNEGFVSSARISTRLFRIMSLLLLVAIILSAVSGSNPIGPQSTQSQRDKARGEAGASAVLFTLAAIVLLGMTIFIFTRLSAVRQQDDRTIVLVVLACLPFLAIRLLYSLLTAFDGYDPGHVFYRLAPNVWVEAFMSVLEEFIIIVMIFAAGLWVSPVKVRLGQEVDPNSYAKQPRAENYQGDVEMGRRYNVNRG